MAKPRYEDELFSVLHSLGLPPKALTKAEDPTEVVEDVTTYVETASAPREGTTPSSVTLKNLFRHPDAHPLLLDLVLLRKYGPEFLGWEPETLERAIPHDFNTTLSHVNLSKVQACKTLHLVDSPWQRWEVFNWVTMALNQVPPDFEVLQVPTVAQVAVMVDTANRVRTDVTWSDEVKAFIQSVFDHEQLFFTVPPLDFIDLYVPDTIDVEVVHARWSNQKETPPTDETIEGEQIRRMLTVTEYVRDYQNRLRNQLEILRHV